MSAISSKKPVTSCDYLVKSLTFALHDIYVVVHSASKNLFLHRMCSERKIATKGQVETFLKRHQVAYFDVSSSPELMEQWESCMKAFDCQCILNKVVLDPTNIPLITAEKVEVTPES